MDKRIFHLKNKLSQTMGESWSVEKMAAEVDMSHSYFQHLFKEEMGTTPMAYLSDLRLEKAREMLADQSCFRQVKEIAYLVGLKNDSHFTQDFKAKFGVTPREYARQEAEIHQSESPSGHK